MAQDPYIIKNPPKYKPTNNKVKYLVEIITEVKNNTSSKTYDLAIEYNTSHQFLWTVSNLKINHSKIFSKVEELYLKANTPLLHLDFITNEFGTITHLMNNKDILKQWERTKEIISHEFSGAEVNQMIYQIDKIYQNEKLLMQAINKDLIVRLFFENFLNENLIYGGESYGNTNLTSYIQGLSIPIKIARHLQLEQNDLALKTNHTIDKINLNVATIKNKYNIEHLEPDEINYSRNAHVLLDYNSVWMKSAKVEQKFSVGEHYFKNKILILKSI
jgi:hypothetical protein